VGEKRKGTTDREEEGEKGEMSQYKLPDNVRVYESCTVCYESCMLFTGRVGYGYGDHGCWCRPTRFKLEVLLHSHRYIYMNLAPSKSYYALSNKL